MWPCVALPSQQKVAQQLETWRRKDLAKAQSPQAAMLTAHVSYCHILSVVKAQLDLGTNNQQCCLAGHCQNSSPGKWMERIPGWRQIRGPQGETSHGASTTLAVKYMFGRKTHDNQEPPSWPLENAPHNMGNSVSLWFLLIESPLSLRNEPQTGNFDQTVTSTGFPPTGPCRMCLLQQGQANAEAVIAVPWPSFEEAQLAFSPRMSPGGLARSSTKMVPKRKSNLGSAIVRLPMQLGQSPHGCSLSLQNLHVVVAIFPGPKRIRICQCCILQFGLTLLDIVQLIRHSWNTARRPKECWKLPGYNPVKSHQGKNEKQARTPTVQILAARAVASLASPCALARR